MQYRVRVRYKLENWPLAYTGYALLGIVASVVSTATAVTGVVMAAVALLALLVDLSGRVPSGRLLTGRRGSQNVLSREIYRKKHN